jgi:ABC-2 type transport system ATP-binding protein
MIGLDPHAIKELKNLFVELKEEGCSLLISTHMIDSIEELWDTTFIMKGGKIAAAVSREDLADGTKKLEDIFFEITENASDEGKKEV